MGRDLINHNEAAALLAGINPRFVGDILRFEEADPTGKLLALDELTGRKPEQFPTEIAPLVREAKKKISELKEKVAYQFPGHWVERSRIPNERTFNTLTVKPGELMRWALIFGLSVPEAALRMSEKLNVDIKPAQVQLLIQKNRELETEVARLKEEIAGLKDDELNPKVKTSLQKMILTMAVSKYRWDMEKKKQRAHASIVEDAERLGIIIDQGTIKEHLDRASTEITWGAPR